MENASRSRCANCQRTPLPTDKPLKPCAKCKGIAYYCNRECQTKHWKKHKVECGKPPRVATTSSSTPGTSPEPASFIQQPHPHPFQALTKRQWLSNRPQHDVYTLLHDTFRLRLEDSYSINNEIEIGSIYHNDNEDSGEAFKGFLQIVREKGLTPEWLDGRKLNECLLHSARTVVDISEWGGLKTKATEADILKWYGDESMALQMRIFAEQAYGDDPSGQAGDMTLRARFMVD